MLIGMLVLGLGTSAQAITIFEDNFNSENGGAGALNYSGFSNWTISSGTVDLIGNGFFDFYPGNGLYVDLDGSTVDAGLMTSNMIFSPGTYTLSFDLGGSQRGDSNDVTVTFGTYSEVFTRASSAPLALVTRTITIDTSGALSFNNAGGDNVGAILDNVSVATTVPEPSTMILIGTGIVGMLGFFRGKSKSFNQGSYPTMHSI